MRVTPASRPALLLGRVLRDVACCWCSPSCSCWSGSCSACARRSSGILFAFGFVLLLASRSPSLSYALGLTVEDRGRVGAAAEHGAVPLLLLSGILLPMTLAPAWLAGLSRATPSGTSSRDARRVPRPLRHGHGLGRPRRRPRGGPRLGRHRGPDVPARDRLSRGHRCGISASFPPGCPVMSSRTASRASPSGNVPPTGTTRSPAPASCDQRGPGPRRGTPRWPGCRRRPADPGRAGPADRGDRDDPVPVGDQLQRDVDGLVGADRVDRGRDPRRRGGPDPVGQARRRTATGTPPNRRTVSKLRSLAVPTARAPSSRACCSTLTPTAPDAPCTRIVSPAPTLTACSASAAVAPTSSRLPRPGSRAPAGLANTPRPGR